MSEIICFFRLTLTAQIESHVAMWTHHILFMLEIIYSLIKIIRHTFSAGGVGSYNVNDFLMTVLQ